MWGVERPIVEMPEDIANLFSAHSIMLFSELLEHKLEFQLVERKEGDGHIHVYEKIGINPPWYSDLWWEHSRSKVTGKVWSNWRRDRTLSALQRMCVQEDQPLRETNHNVLYKYDTRLRELVSKHFSEGYNGLYGIAIPDDLDPKGTVREFLIEHDVIKTFKYAGAE